MERKNLKIFDKNMKIFDKNIKLMFFSTAIIVLLAFFAGKISENFRFYSLTDIRYVGYRKTEIKNSIEQGDPHRISATFTTNEYPMTTTLEHKVKFVTEIEGDTRGIEVDKKTIVSKEKNKGMSIAINKNSTGYVAIIPEYSVERGIREVYDKGSGKTLERNKYTVKTPKTYYYTVIYE